MESCGFVNEEFPAEIQKLAKELQVLVELSIVFFYTLCVPSMGIFNLSQDKLFI
jgi:hypothetical protein